MVRSSKWASFTPKITELTLPTYIYLRYLWLMTHLLAGVNDQVWCLCGTRSSPTSSNSFCQNRWIFLQTCLPLNTTSVVLNCSCSYGHFYGKIMFWILNHQIWEFELYFQTSSSGKVFEGAVKVRWWCFGWFLASIGVPKSTWKQMSVPRIRSCVA